MADQQQQRRARVVPERELTDAENDQQLDLLNDDADRQTDAVLTPEQQADEHKRQIEALTAQSQADRQARAEAERIARENASKFADAQKDALTAQERAVETQIETNNRLIQQAKTALRAARESGDFDAEEKALDSLTDAKAQLVHLNNQKQFLAETKKVQPQQQAPAQQQQPYRGAHGFSEASENWLKNHPRFDTDPYYKTMVLQAANAAVMSNIPPDSPQFFQFMDDVMTKAFPPSQPQQQSNQQQQRRTPPASSMAAPPSRSNGNAQQNGNTPNAATVARALGVTVDDLATFAKIAKMSFDKYVAEQAQIIEEEKAGINTGLYRSEGR